MKNSFFAIFIFIAGVSYSQERKFPVVEKYGGVFNIPQTVPIPDPSLNYEIIIEVEGGTDNPEEINFALNNIARLINLHGLAGIPKEKLKVIVAVHGEATSCMMNNDQYLAKYKTGNPNLDLLKELKKAGVEFYVCGQSLLARKIDTNKLVSEVQVALSALTTITTYQLKGFAFLKF